MTVGQVQPTIPRYGVKVTTVDPAQGIVEVVFKSGDVRQVSVYTTGAAFRWPQAGENWMVRQENGSWYLEGFWPDQNASTPFLSVDPGDVIINTPTGVVHVVGSNADPVIDYTLTPPIAWTPFPPLVLPITPINNHGLVSPYVNYGSPWQVAEYQIDAFKRTQLRGTVTKPTPWVLGETIAWLPSGYWPAAGEIFTAHAYDSIAGNFIARIDVLATGAINLTYAVPAIVSPGNLTYLSLASISFSTT